MLPTGMGSVCWVRAKALLPTQPGLVGTPAWGPSDKRAWAWGAVGWVDLLTCLDELGQVKANLFWKKEISSAFQALSHVLGLPERQQLPQTINKQMGLTVIL